MGLSMGVKRVTWMRMKCLSPLVALLGLAAACGGESITEPVQGNPEGIWRTNRVGVSESTVRLAGDGSFTRVIADLAGSSCESAAGTWRVDGETLRIQISAVDNAPASSVETYSFTLEGGRLRLDGVGLSDEFSAVSSMVSCVDYGFGSWGGLLRAEVDGIPIEFDVVGVRVDVDAGAFEIEGFYSSGPDERQLVLQIDGSPGLLEPGSFTVQNVPGATDTFYGLYHPEPGSVTFSGFDTTRLSPPGTLTFSTVVPERVVATFSFRANPRVEGETGPAGATFAQIEAGRVDLTYR